MNCEVVYVCNSTNNKNVRANELNVLRKFEDKLYFEFGDSENNIKKRFYKDVEVLNKDFKAIEKIKSKIEEEKIKEDKKESIELIQEKTEEIAKDADTLEPVAIATKKEELKTEVFKKNKNKNGKRKIF